VTPEGKVKEAIKKALKARNIPYWMVIPNAMGNSRGMADFIGILPDGRFLAIEAKADGKSKNLTVHQKKFLDDIGSNGGKAFVVSNLEELEEAMRCLV
jgi:penicillin-binding protein-related factor A (putative recombinase)